jgi:hypothetical protein
MVTVCDGFERGLHEMALCGAALHIRFGRVMCRQDGVGVQDSKIRWDEVKQSAWVPGSYPNPNPTRSLSISSQHSERRR